MTFGSRFIPCLRVVALLVLSSAFTVMLLSRVAAHEVQPAVADLEIAGDRVTLSIDMTLEAPLAGVDLDGLEDTNAAENAGAYDALRALAPETLAAKVRAAWPTLADRFTLRAGETALEPRLLAVEVPEMPNPDLPRISRLRFDADLPPGNSPVVFGWEASLGTLVLRQVGIEDGYTALLSGGDLSDPIPRTGGDTRGAGEIFVTYVASGFDHIVPKGLDHILFVLGLFFFALAWGPMLWQVSAFTVAHTLTLGMAASGVIAIPASLMWAVEALIALSIAYVGIENLFRPRLGWLRPTVVFGFGLLHGLGFASVLGEFGLPTGQFVAALLAFNVGVEIGQLSVIGGAFLLILAARAAATIADLDDDEAMTRDLAVTYRALSLAGSILISIIGLYWTAERIGLFSV